MKKSRRILLYVLIIAGSTFFFYQFILPIINKGIPLIEPAYVDGVLKGTVSNSSYKYVLIHLYEQDSMIFITEGNTTRSVSLQVFDTVNIEKGKFSYTYKLKEPFVFPRIICLANDSGICELVAFQNPYINRPNSSGGICMDRGAQIILTIDGRNLHNSKIMGSPGTDALFKRSAEVDAKARVAKKALLQKKKAAEHTKQIQDSKQKAAEHAKQIQDSIQNVYKHLDTATFRHLVGRSKIYLKPKRSQAQ